MENQLHIALKTNKLFEGISISSIDLSSIKGNLFTIKEGEILFREGDPFKYIYFVVSGELNLLSKYISERSNSTIISVNDFLGQDEYLNQSNRVSTVVALRDSYIIGFDNSEIKNLIGQDERILLKLKASCYFNQPSIDVKNNQETILQETDEAIKSSDLTVEENHEPNEKHSLVLNDDVDAAMTVEPENFESPDDYEEHIEDYEINNLNSGSEQEQELTNEEIESFKLVDETEEDEVSTEPLGDDLPVDDLISEDDNLYLDGISSEEELRKIDELIQTQKQETETIDEEELSSILDEKIQNSDELMKEEIAPQDLETINGKDELLSENTFTETDNLIQKDDSEQINENNSADESLDFLNEDSGSLTNDDNLEQFNKDDKNLEGLINETDSTQAETRNDYDTEKYISESVVTETQSELIDELEATVEKNEPNNKSALSTAKLGMIIKAAELVNSNIKVQDVLTNIVNVAADLINADRGTLYLVEHEKKKIWSEVAMGNELKEIHLNIGEGIAGTVAETGETINIPDASVDERFQSSFDKVSGYTTTSILCMSIKNKEGIIVGVLQLLNSKNGKFTELDEELLNALSLFIAIALENAHLVERLLKTERIDSLGKMTNFLIQDIKKPVLVSKRYADHLLEKELPNDTKQVLEMMDDQLNHVADLVQTTSSYSQGHSILRAIPQNINDTLINYSNRLDSYLRTSNCSLSNEFDKDVVVKIDSKEFYQCFYQIVRNAVEAMPDGGKLKIATSTDNSKVEISFSDDGLGINESLLEKIFEPFMTFGKKNGTGLGLSITKKVIEDHGGSIGVVSSLGEGATFTLTLPLANAV